MVASMPLPSEPDDEEAVAERDGREAAPSRVTKLPARSASRAPRPRKKKAAAAPAVVDPGPPPPLPPEFVEAGGDLIAVPPRPPLPSAAPDAAPVEKGPVDANPVAEPRVEEVVEATPDVEEAPVVEVEPEADVPVVDVSVADERVVDERVVDESAVGGSVIDTQSVAADELAVGLAPVADGSVAALTLHGVVKTFGDTRAVDGIDLTVPAGTFYGIVGPNGAGKTTTLSMIAGLLQPTRGRIAVNGVALADDPVAAKRAMGVLPDRLRTFDRLTGRQLLYYYGVLRRLAPAVVESRTADLARAFDLTDALGRVVSDYSAGMTKKIMLAGAMIHSPRLLVLDEPFEAVDPVSSAVILDILSAYVAHGGTVLLSSHGMELVERVCTRVAVLVGGQVLAEGTVADVRGELTLEQRLIELAGGIGDVEGLEWLHTFSG